MILKSESEQAGQPPTSFLGFWVFREQTVIVVAKRPWESGKPAFGFPLFHGREAGLWECGNLAAFARFPSGGGKGGKAAFAFPGFPPPRHFHSPFCRCHAIALHDLFRRPRRFDLAAP